MERHKRVTFSFSMLMLVLASMWTTGAAPVAAASEILFWTGNVYSSGEEVVTPVLGYGIRYRIVAYEIFWYNYSANLAADAQYYTTDPSDPWMWGNWYHCFDAHSFLQINGEDVDWGSFSNGDTGHMYSRYYTGKGAAITLRIFDWRDFNYTNNYSHFPIEIYYEPTIVGGVLTPANKLAVTAPCLTLVGLVAALSTVFAVRRKRKAQITSIDSS